MIRFQPDLVVFVWCFVLVAVGCQQANETAISKNATADVANKDLPSDTAVNASPSTSSKFGEVCPTPTPDFDAKEDEATIKNLYAEFLGGNRKLLEVCIEKRQPVPTAEKFIQAVRDTDDLQKEIVAIADRTDSSLLSQQLLGELAYFYFIARKTMHDTPALASVPMGQELLSIESIKSTSKRAFEKSISLAPDFVSLPYDRLARLALFGGGSSDAGQVAENLLMSIKNDPSSPLSIDPLVLVLMDTAIVDNSHNYQYIFETLRTVRGDALDELKASQESVQSEIRELMVLSERSAILGWVDEETQSRLRHLYSVNALIQGVVAPGQIAVVRPR